VSHDFRTPLTAMIGAASTLIEMGSALEPDQQQELLNSILTEAIRLNGYTQKLLDMTRLGHGELTLHRSTVSIEEIINFVIKRFKSQKEDQRLELDIESHLPLLDVHAALIEQALYNVIENALKFAPTDSRIAIRVRMHE
jgi:two-component system sensor histidine kinase KdpD